VEIGRGCKIQNNVSVYEGVILEDDVFCGPSMVFTNVLNPRSRISRRREFQRTLVKKGTTIGANATVICGRTLGRYSFIGAGAVVTKDAPDHALMLGNPAVQKGWICSCGVRLYDDLTCPACGAQYAATENGITEITPGGSE
jgi:UDP-2-acetamido-3-amino-2,3-dideoxy-glucuronate N-acetyltransferase